MHRERTAACLRSDGEEGRYAARSDGSAQKKLHKQETLHVGGCSDRKFKLSMKIICLMFSKDIGNQHEEEECEEAWNPGTEVSSSGHERPAFMMFSVHFLPLSSDCSTSCVSVSVMDRICDIPRCSLFE